MSWAVKRNKALFWKLTSRKHMTWLGGIFLKSIKGKGSLEWIDWVMQSVREGQVCVNINGTRSPYSKTFRGLRQGALYPLSFSTCLLMLSVVCWTKLLTSTLSREWFPIWSPMEFPISNMQMTLIMIDRADSSITNLKILLYCFEWLSGLKINYHKSEVILFGYSQEEK